MRRRRITVTNSFWPSIAFVLGAMLLAGLAQYAYLEVLIPRGIPEQGWFRYLLGAWGLVLVVGAALWAKTIFKLLSSVRTSVTILSLFAICCVLGSFVLQKRDLDSRGLKGEKAYAAFRLAEAGFLHYMFKGQKYEHPMSENGKLYFKTIAERFGEKYAGERAELFHKMMGGRTKDAEIEEFADEHDDFFRALWNFCRVTRLYDIHRSWAFITLMTLLSLSLLAGTWKRFVWRGDQIGFYSTHMGFFVLMVGFTLSMSLEERGILPLEVGKTLDEIWEFNANKPKKLPFQVTLQDFYTEHHHELFVNWRDIDFQAKGFPGPVQRGLKALAGNRYELFEGKYEIEVVDHSEYGSAAPDVVDSPDGPPQPAIQVDVSSPDGAGAAGYLFAGDGAQAIYEDPAGRFLLSFHADEAAALAPPIQGVWGELGLHEEGHEPRLIEVKPGATWKYAGKDFRIAQIATDFANREQPLEAQQVSNPALLLEITEEGGETQQRWTFAWLDFDQMHTPAHAEVRLRYRFRSGDLELDKVARVLGSEGGLELLRFAEDGSVSRQPIEIGEALPLGIEEFTLKIDRRFERAARVYVVTPDYERDRLEQDRQQEASGWAGSTSDRQAVQLSEGDASGEPASEADPHAGHDHGPGEHDGHDHGPAGSANAQPSESAAVRALGPLAPDVQRRFHPPGPPAAKLRIKHPGGEFERWFLSGHPDAGVWTDGVLDLRFSPNTNKVKEWRSLLVASDGKEVRRQVVRVNTTLDFRGWTMYQTDADAKRPNYSGIQVLKDPGWYLIEPGLLMVCFGVIFMFWIKPWLRMDQSGGRSAKPALGGKS